MVTNRLIFVSILMLPFGFAQNNGGGILNGWPTNNQKVSVVDSRKDLVQPNEKHLSGIPKFLQHPKPVYFVSKDQPIQVTCIAEPVSHVNIFCADKEYSYMNEAISASGLRVEKLNRRNQPDETGKRWKFSLVVRHKDVVEWFSEYRCYCEAWNLIEELQRVKKVVSSSANVIESYLNREFKKTPKSQRIMEGERLELTCIPPDAKPLAEIFWMVNGERIGTSSKSSAASSSGSSSKSSSSSLSVNSNVQVNDYRQLVIRSVKLTNSGNYSCVAQSLSKIRTAVAQIVVLKAGKWLEWSDWNRQCPVECYSKDRCPSTCETVTRQRKRQCDTTASGNSCHGDRIDTQRCDIHCGTDIWTFWSTWSACTGVPCQKSRSKRCLIPERCVKQLYLETVNCSVAECALSASNSNVKWTPWSEWNRLCPLKCYSKEKCPADCDSITRRRQRQCVAGSANPATNNNNNKVNKNCAGASVDVQRCDAHCGIASSFKGRNKNGDINTIYSDSSSDGGSNIRTQDIPMYVGLSMAVLVFLMIVIVIWCLFRRRVIGFSPTRVWRYSTASNGMSLFDTNKNFKKNFSNLSSTKQMHHPPALYQSMVLPHSLSGLNGALPNQQRQQQQKQQQLQCNSDTSSNAGYTDVGNDLTYMSTTSGAAAGAGGGLHQIQQSISMMSPNMGPMSPHALLPHDFPTIRPSYSDSKVGGFANSLGNMRAVVDGGVGGSSSGGVGLVRGNQPLNSANTNINNNGMMKNNMSTLPLIPFTMSRPSSEHYQEISIVNDLDEMEREEEEDDDDDDHDGNDDNDENNGNRDEMYTRDSHSKTELRGDDYLTNTISDVKAAYPDDHVCWVSAPYSQATTVSLPLSDVSLLCPANVFPVGFTENLFLLASNSDRDLPPLSNKDTLLSPIVVCGPSNVMLLKPVILTFPHSAHLAGRNISTLSMSTSAASTGSSTCTPSSSGSTVLPDNNNVPPAGRWYLTILTSSSPLNQKAKWEVFLDLPYSNDDNQPADISLCNYDNSSKNSFMASQGCTKLLPDRVLLMTTRLQRYCLVGRSTHPLIDGIPPSLFVSKVMRVVAYATDLEIASIPANVLMTVDSNGCHPSYSKKTDFIVLRVYLVPDCGQNSTLARIHETETTKMGGKLLALYNINQNVNDNSGRTVVSVGSSSGVVRSNQCQFLYQDEAGNLNITITELAADWELSMTNVQHQIPFQTMWHYNGYLTATFSFRHKQQQQQQQQQQSTLKEISASALLIQQQQQQQQKYKPSAVGKGSNFSDPWFCVVSLQQPHTAQQSQLNLVLCTSNFPQSNPASTNQIPLHLNDDDNHNIVMKNMQPQPQPPYFIDDCCAATNPALHYQHAGSLRPVGNVIFRLPDFTRKKLCKLLDPLTPPKNDWRQLAVFLSVHKYLPFFSYKSSPTDVLLDLWEAQNVSKQSLTSLLDFFRSISRLDCVSVLENDLFVQKV